MNRLRPVLLIFLQLLCYATAAWAAPNDSAVEQHVLDITRELRCLVCQNQTIAESNAELAVDLRNQVREKLVQGMGEREIIDFMVGRYGDFILYRPPLKTTTWLLWFGPLLLLAAGSGFLFIRLRAQKERPPSIDEDERRRAAALLHDADKEGENA